MLTSLKVVLISYLLFQYTIFIIRTRFRGFGLPGVEKLSLHPYRILYIFEHQSLVIVQEVIFCL